MVPACRSTVRFTSFGIWSHCSGVGLSRTAPPVAVRTPWWTSSMPAVFSSKNMPLYSRLKTSTFEPALLEVLAVVQGQPALGRRQPPRERPQEKRRGQGQASREAEEPVHAVLRAGPPAAEPAGLERRDYATVTPPAPGPGRAERRDRGILGLTRSPRVDREDIHEFRDPS